MNTPRYKPLVFENYDRSKGFESFKECFDHWIAKKGQDDSIDLKNTFKIDFLPNKEDFKENSKWVIGLDQTQDEYVEEYLEFTFLGYVENRFQCSGMCTPSLFYFNRNISEFAIPRNTCL